MEELKSLREWLQAPEANLFRNTIRARIIEFDEEKGKALSLYVESSAPEHLEDALRVSKKVVELAHFLEYLDDALSENYELKTVVDIRPYNEPLYGKTTETPG